MPRQDQTGVRTDPRIFDEPDGWAAELTEISHELNRVLSRWGKQSLTLFDWVSVLGEEYGELCRAVNVYEFETGATGSLDNLYKEAVQVAAVAVHIAAAIRAAGPS